MEISLTGMNAEVFVEQLKIAAPCNARWDDMAGTEQVRFCLNCQKNVYSFTSMSADEARALIMQKEGRVCGRFYQRTDGRLMTQNCPIGVHRRARKAAYAALLLLFSGITAFAVGDAQTRRATVVNRSRFNAQLEDLTWEVKGWFGIKRPVAPRMLMGDICPTPVQKAPQATPGKSS